jgi:hypothetical protein
MVSMVTDWRSAQDAWSLWSAELDIEAPTPEAAMSDAAGTVVDACQRTGHLPWKVHRSEVGIGGHFALVRQVSFGEPFAL